MQLKDFKILIVDDSEISLANLEDSLMAIGATQFRKASSVNEAISLLSSELKIKPFDVVICDHHIHDRFGLDLLKQINSDSIFKNIKFFVCTSDGQRDVVISYLKNGARGFINKPFHHNDVLSKLNAIK